MEAGGKKPTENGRTGGYYNTRELDNNSVNEQRESHRGRMDPIDERPERDRGRGGNRGYPPRDPPGRRSPPGSRGYPDRDYPSRGSPREDRDRYPRDNRRGYGPGPARSQYGPSQTGRSYDDMFNSRMQSGAPLPRGPADVRNYMSPRGFRRY